MKILEFLISSDRGGAEATIYDFSKFMINKDVDLKILLNYNLLKYFKDINKNNILNIGIYFKYLNGKQLFKNGFLNIICSKLIHKFKNSFLKEINERIILKKIKKYIIKFNPDILHIQTEDALKLFAKINIRYNIPIVFTIRGHMYLNEKSSNFKIESEKILIKFAFKKIDYIVSECNYFFEIIKRAGIDFNENKKVLIPKGINLNKIKNIKPFRLKKCFKILFVGGARYLKGGDILVKALPLIKKEIPDFKLYILRNVPENHFIKNFVLKNNLVDNVKFIGFLDYPDYYRFLKSVDVGVLPSRTEGIAPSIIEFMECSIPVIATKVGGTPEIIKNDVNGILAEPNPESIANSLIYLYKHPEIMDRLSKNGLLESKKYSLDINFEKWLFFFKNIIHEKQ